MARKKIREYDSKRILKEHLQRLANISLAIKSAQVPPPLSPIPTYLPTYIHTYIHTLITFIYTYIHLVMKLIPFLPFS